MRLNNYLHSQFAITFFPIFLGLSFITSIVILVKIAALTSIITMDFSELFKLFSYAIPQIVFYTMPVSFFLSLAITLSKLSSEYELTVITSFGLNPLKIIKIFLPITAILTFISLVISIGLIPKVEFLKNEFIDQKKNEANFNIKPGEFGQKFGDWLIYISDQEDKVYKNIKLFKTEKGQEQFITSKEAILDNDKGRLSFRLMDGKVFIMERDELNQIDYESMYINDSITQKDRFYDFTTSYSYWKAMLGNNLDISTFTFYFLASLFPIISLFFIVTFGYFNPRYEKNRTVVYSIITIVIYYMFVKYIGDKLLLHAIYIIPILWLASSYFLYSKTIKKEY